MPQYLSEQAVGAFLATFSPDAQTLARAARGILLDLFPEAIETAEGREFGYGFDRGYKGLVFTISLKKSGINIGVVGGASLPDPDGMLAGTGKLHRHIEITRPASLNDPRLIQLLGAALARRRPAS